MSWGRIIIKLGLDGFGPEVGSFYYIIQEADDDNNNDIDDVEE